MFISLEYEDDRFRRSSKYQPRPTNIECDLAGGKICYPEFLEDVDECGGDESPTNAPMLANYIRTIPCKLSNMSKQNLTQIKSTTAKSL